VDQVNTVEMIVQTAARDVKKRAAVDPVKE
jgi:hypothetical protein